MEEQKRNPAQGLSESEQVQVRRQKLADLQAAGNDPFTLTKFPQDAYSADLKEEFKDLPNETDSGKHVALAGRMMSKRVMGKASFAHLRDDKGDIQLYVRRDELGEEAYAAFKKLDVGDIIGVKGEVFRTKTGELSVRATELTLLAKSLRPLPEKFHGLTDTEMRYRQRYVDLIANPEVKDTFVKRSQILKEIRAYLDEKGFLEVDTPILTPFEIGASARPFYTHRNTLNIDMVLRIETADREHPVLPSVCDLWHSANLNEREVYDFYGIRFTGHPDMRRLYLRNDWCDARGMLSWHAQPNDRLLDEAGSYGEAQRIKIPANLLPGIVQEGRFALTFRVKGSGGLALYGRESGRYGYGMTLKVEK